MAFRPIQWLAVALPALAVGIFELFRHQWLEPLLPGMTGDVLAALVVAGVVYGFVRLFIGMVQQAAGDLTRARAEAAVIVERQRIAREMHDRVAQALFHLGVRLHKVAGLLAAGEVERARDEIEALQGHVKDAYAQVRAVIADLKEQANLEDFSEALRRTAVDLSRRLVLEVTCQAEVHPALPAVARQHLLAIVQEAVTNAERHGGARRATVRLFAQGRDLVLEVADDGAGFDPAKVPREGRYGLRIMAERAQMAGGELVVDAAPGRGTRIQVRLPGVVA